jgi:predicted Zn-dependent peptidase
MTSTTDPLVAETVVRDRLPSGLAVAVVPRPGQRRTYATFATRYGSIDSHFRVPGTGEALSVPDGIAHFLEHKMFEAPDGDVFNRFAALGASANAYTEYTTTTYLFSTTAHGSECLDILLDFVQAPYFTPENVEKEKGIIEQEIRMYLDMPQDRLHSNLMRALYVAHPVRLDIAGTVESIQGITPDILYRCYETFYHPSNMLVFVVGDVDADQVLDQVRRDQARRQMTPSGPIERLLPEEPPQVAERRVEHRMPVHLPLVAIGYKDQVGSLAGPELLRRDVVTSLLWAMVLGKSSPLYASLYEAGLVNDRLQARYEQGPTFGHSIVATETPDPDTLVARIQEGVASAPLTEEALERAKRRELGDYVTVFNNPEALAYVYNAWHFRDTDPFLFPEILDAVTLEDVVTRRDTYLATAPTAVSVVLPLTR